MTAPFLSVVTPCKGRLGALKFTAPRMHGVPGVEHVIVDYDCPDGTASWARENLPGAVVVKVFDRPVFNLSAARNAGIAAASGRWIMIADADIWIPDFARFVSWLIPHLRDNEFVMASRWDEGKGGILIAPRDGILPRGYDESLRGYGYDDDEMAWFLLKRMGMVARSVPSRWFRHLPHDDSSRSAHYDRDVDASMKRNSMIVRKQYADAGVRGDAHWHPEWAWPIGETPNVSVRYDGRFGNCMFEYATARIFAEDHDLSMENLFDGDGIVCVDPWHGGRTFGSGDGVMVRNWDFEHGGVVDGNSRVLFFGHFQKASWYWERRDRILGFYHADPMDSASVNHDDVLVNLRVAQDYRDMRWIIHPRWYLDILRTLEFRRLHVVADEIDPEYLSHFRRFDPIVSAPGPKASWDILRSFNRVVIPNSSFSWWAMFFGCASKIWTFRRWVDRPTIDLSTFPGAIPVDGPFLHELPFPESV